MPILTTSWTHFFLFFSLRSTLAAAIYYDISLLPHTHTLCLSVRPTAYYTNILVSSIFQARLPTFPAAPNREAILSHRTRPQLERQPRSALSNAQVPLLVTACLSLAPRCFGAPLARPNRSQASTPQVPVPCGRTRHWHLQQPATPNSPSALCEPLNCYSLEATTDTPPKPAPSAVSPGPLAR